MSLPTRTYLTVVEAGVAETGDVGGSAQGVTLAIPGSTPPLAPGDVLIIAARGGIPPEPPAVEKVRAA